MPVFSAMPDSRQNWHGVSNLDLRPNKAPSWTSHPRTSEPELQSPWRFNIGQTEQLFGAPNQHIEQNLGARNDHMEGYPAQRIAQPWNVPAVKHMQAGGSHSFTAGDSRGVHTPREPQLLRRGLLETPQQPLIFAAASNAELQRPSQAPFMVLGRFQVSPVAWFAFSEVYPVLKASLLGSRPPRPLDWSKMQRPADLDSECMERCCERGHVAHGDVAVIASRADYCMVARAVQFGMQIDLCGERRQQILVIQ